MDRNDLLEAAIGVTLCIVVLAVACWVMWLDYRRRERRDEQPDVGLSIFDRSNRLDSTDDEVIGLADLLKRDRQAADLRAVHIEPSPTLTSYAGRLDPPHRPTAPGRALLLTYCPGQAPPAWADGETTEEFRRVVGLPVDVQVHREVLLPERPTWAQPTIAGWPVLTEPVEAVA